MPDLRPRSIGRVLDEAFGIYRANFMAVAGLAMVVLLPVSLATNTLQAFANQAWLPALASIAEDATGIMRAQLYLVLTYALLPLLLLAQAYVATGVIRSAGDMLFGRAVRLRELLRPGMGAYLSYVATAVIVGVAVAVTTPFFLVPGIVVGVLLSLAPVVVVAEDTSPIEALRRSYDLTSRNPFRVLGFFILLGVFAFVLEAMFTSPTAIRTLFDAFQNPDAIVQPVSTGWKTLEGVLGGLALSLVFPFTQLAWFALYVDMRARREGLDLIVSAEEVSRRAEP